MNQPKVTFICCYNNKEQLSRMLHTSIQNLDHSICTINSIFVDAMVADNNDDVMNKLNELQKSLDDMKKQMKHLQ